MKQIEDLEIQDYLDKTLTKSQIEFLYYNYGEEFYKHSKTRQFDHEIIPILLRDKFLNKNIDIIFEGILNDVTNKRLCMCKSIGGRRIKTRKKRTRRTRKRKKRTKRTRKKQKKNKR